MISWLVDGLFDGRGVGAVQLFAQHADVFLQRVGGGGGLGRAGLALRQADALAAQLAELQAKQTERGIVITFGDVLFNTDQAVLTEGGQRTLRKLADVLNQNPDRSVMVEGFTDSTGSSAHNLELSQRRAEAVRSALMAMGIEGTRVATRGYGEAYPVAGNDSAGNRQLNRRVEIVLSDAGRPVNSRR